MLLLIDTALFSYYVRADPCDHLEIPQVVAEASMIVMNYLKLEEPPLEWYSGSPQELTAVPFDVQAAVKFVAAELYKNREASTADPLSPVVKDILRRRRDPALA